MKITRNNSGYRNVINGIEDPVDYWLVVDDDDLGNGRPRLIAKFMQQRDAQQFLKAMQHRIDLANAGKDVIHG